MPLGSTNTLLMPPTFAGPGAIPLIGAFPEPAAPATLAYEAEGAASATRSASASFVVVLDMTKLHYFTSAYV